MTTSAGNPTIIWATTLDFCPRCPRTAPHLWGWKVSVKEPHFVMREVRQKVTQHPSCVTPNHLLFLLYCPQEDNVYSSVLRLEAGCICVHPCVVRDAVMCVFRKGWAAWPWGAGWKASEEENVQTRPPGHQPHVRLLRAALHPPVL